VLTSADIVLYPDLRESHKPAFKDHAAEDRVLATISMVSVKVFKAVRQGDAPPLGRLGDKA